MLLPAVQKVRSCRRADAEARTTSSNSASASTTTPRPTDNKLPPGIDDKNFSALFHLLPYLEQDNLYKAIDKTKR